MTSGTLTVATESPAHQPWFVDEDPSNGKGFESAVAYAVAGHLGYSAEQVKWVKFPYADLFLESVERDFDFDINQIVISSDPSTRSDLSDSYYSAAQAVIALENSQAATSVTSVSSLAGMKLGAQSDTVSLSVLRDAIKPATAPLEFSTVKEAERALANGQVDAILADLPTAFYLTEVEIPEAVIVGQFRPETGGSGTGGAAQFAMLLDKGNPLLSCVNAALAEMRDNGELDQLEQEWLSEAVEVPFLE